MRRACLALLLAAACIDEEARPGGECPEGETCSDVTPDGLSFLGAALGDDSVGRGEPRPMAVGGTQTLRVLTGEASGAPPFETAFVATTTDATLGVAGATPPDVIVQGLVAGRAFLRIAEPASDELFDRIELEVEAIAEVAIVPKSAALDADFVEQGGPFLLYAGGSDALVVKLRSAEGERLVDESLRLAVSGDGVAAGAREAWDTLRVSGQTAGTGTVAVRPGDGTDHDQELRVVTTVDDIRSVRAVGGAASTDEPQSSNREALFCFRATSGGTLVAGVTWSYAPVAGLTLTPVGSCVKVRSELPSATTLAVTAAGVTREFLVSFAAP